MSEHTHGRSPGARKSRLIYPASRTLAKKTSWQELLGDSSSFGEANAEPYRKTRTKKASKCLPCPVRYRYRSLFPGTFPGGFGSGSPLSPAQMPPLPCHQPPLDVAKPQLPPGSSPGAQPLAQHLELSAHGYQQGQDLISWRRWGSAPRPRIGNGKRGRGCSGPFPAGPCAQLAVEVIPSAGCQEPHGYGEGDS